MTRFLSLLISIPFIILMAAFAFKNAQPVSVDLFFLPPVSIPLAVILLIALFLGVVLGYLFNVFALLVQKKKYRQLEKKQEALQGLSGVLHKQGK